MRRPVRGLTLDPVLVARARELAARAAAPVVELATTHTTVSVERSILRLAGLTGTDPVLGGGRADSQVPWVNRVVDAVREQVGLEHGAAVPVWHALAAGGTLQDLAERVGAGTARFTVPAGSTPTGPAASSWWPPSAPHPGVRGST
ncbi:MAG: D-Lysine 56-aminomutase, alpha subunit [Modestobacter sp.]|nr:D-Lysine 56-aminomutase, alpha subunit [Modestobacter sp.]